MVTKPCKVGVMARVDLALVNYDRKQLVLVQSRRSQTSRITSPEERSGMSYSSAVEVLSCTYGSVPEAILV